MTDRRPGPGQGRGAGRSGRARWVLAAILLLPVVELAVAIEVGRRIGTVPTILALIAVSALGMVLIARQGRGFSRVIRNAAATGTRPDHDPADLAVRAGAGFLLAVPGFVTGLLGALLLIPPVRRALGRATLRRAGRGRASAVVVTGEVIDADRPEEPPALGPGDPRPGP